MYLCPRLLIEVVNLTSLNYMPVKIRLQRHGKKGKPFYWVVAADVRASRDGKFLQKIGTYNPNSNPAQIDLDIDEAINLADRIYVLSNKPAHIKEEISLHPSHVDKTQIGEVARIKAPIMDLIRA